VVVPIQKNVMRLKMEAFLTASFVNRKCISEFSVLGHVDVVDRG
jgi:hypothetical protein